MRKQARGFRAQVEQGADGSAGATAGAEFHDLAEQDQSGDGGSSLEVDIRIASHAPQRLWKNLRREGGDQAVSIGDAGAHADQGEHVGTAIHERSPETLEEWPSTPEDYGCCEEEFEPGQIDQNAVQIQIDVDLKAVPDHARHSDG